MSGALPQQPEEFLDHVRNVPHDPVPSVEEELDEYLMLREVSRSVPVNGMFYLVRTSCLNNS